MKTWICLSLVLLLSGCAGMSDTLVTTVTDGFGRDVETVAGASIAKEQIIHSTLKADVEGYYKALEASGAKVEVTGFYEVPLADGKTGYLPLLVATAKEAPARNINLPTAPSEHPGWRFGGKVVDAGLSFGLGWLLNDFGQAALGGAQTKYYGDYNPQTAEPFVVFPEIVTAP